MNSSNRILPPTPSLLNGAALLLWGWQCDFLLYAVAMAVVLESARLIRWRIPITDKEFNYISDLSSVIFFLVVVYAFTTRSYHGIFTILALLPFLFYLLMLAQIYSVQGTMKPSALFISLRKLNATESMFFSYDVDISYPYMFLCMISASAGNKNETLFYMVIVMLTGWTLWQLCPRHTRKYLWGFLLFLSFASGYMGQLGLVRLQAMAEGTFLQWFDQFMWRSRDPNRTTTAIGSLGKLKLSDRIMARVDTHGKKLHAPLYLREATYTSYGYGVWTTYRNSLQLVDPTPDGRQWIINKDITHPEDITVSFYLDEKTAVVPAPAGLGSISNVGATQIEYSPYGALSMEFNPGWVKYDVRYSHDKIYDSTPDKEDLEIPHVYNDDLLRLVGELGLEPLSPAKKVAAVKQFFLENFQYSLTQTQRYPRAQYLSKFLFENRTGHCEYFATATALLLRAAGIPTRYVVGYSVDEYSPLEGQYIARASHAHSWVLAYVDDAWQTIDTTPPIWIPLEEEDKSSIAPLVDLWSWLSYQLAIWNTDESKDNTTRYIWLLFPVLLYYLWKMFIKDRVKKLTAGLPDKWNRIARPGADSGFYKLIVALEKHSPPRKTGETLVAWLTRIEQTAQQKQLQTLLALHYRYRFDPAGLSMDEKQTLENEVKEQLATLH